MSQRCFLSALAVVILAYCGSLSAFGQAPVRAPTSDDPLIWCQPKFDRQVPMSVCEQAFQPQSQTQIAPDVAPERPPSLEDAAASLQKTYDSLTEDPQKIKLAECTGIKIYEEPQPTGHPPSAEECVQVLRQFGFARDKTGKLIELLSADNQKPAQQIDPYADSYQQQATAHFRQELDGLSNTIHNLNFALGCKVLTQQVQISRLIAGPVRALIEKAIQNGVDAVQIHNQLQKAARGGLALASEVGACDHWKQHPDEVYALRRAVEAAYRSFPY
jgi:hypothetical protein